MSTSRIISKVVLFSLVLALSLTVGWAGTLEGSTDVARSITDTAPMQVMIYNGGFFDNGVTVNTFKFFDANGSGTRFVTPILFEETATGVFVVRAIGATDTFSTNADQTFAFGLQAGSATTTSTLFTFGFIEAAVNSSGTVTTASTGGVDLNNPADVGTGVGGLGTTNDWIFTPTPGSLDVTINSVFFRPGSGPSAGPHTFILNNSTDGKAFDQDRTYSANLNAAASGVPEPGTLTLFTSGAGLLLAGLLRFRRRSNK